MSFAGGLKWRPRETSAVFSGYVVGDWACKEKRCCKILPAAQLVGKLAYIILKCGVSPAPNPRTTDLDSNQSKQLISYLG